MNNFRDWPFCNFNLNNSLAPLYRTYFQNILYYYVKCKKCKIVYLDPVPKHTTLVEIYSADKYHDKCYSVDPCQTLGKSRPKHPYRGFWGRSLR